MITISEASKLLGKSINTIKSHIDKHDITTDINEAGVVIVDKQDILKIFPTIITIFNQKGGVGKTSVSYLLGDYFELLGLKVLIVDADPQAHLTTTFIEEDVLFDEEGNMKLKSLFDYFTSRTPLEKLVHKYSENIDIIPSDIRMIEIGLKDSRKLASEDAPKFTSLFKNYNIVIVDCPPNINTFSILGLTLANYIFCPVMLDKLSYGGLTKALDYIKTFRSDDFIDYKVIVNHNTRKAGIKEIYEIKYREVLGKNVLNCKLTENVGIAERQDFIENFFSSKDNLGRKYDIENVMCEILDVIYMQRGNL